MNDQISEWFADNPLIDCSCGHFALIKGVNQDPTDYRMRKECWCEIHIKHKEQWRMTLCLHVTDLDLQADSYKFMLSEVCDGQSNMLLTGEINERRIFRELDPPSGLTQHMEPVTLELSIMLIRFVRAMIKKYLTEYDFWRHCNGKTELFICFGIDRQDKNQLEELSDTLFEDLIIGTRGLNRHHK